MRSVMDGLRQQNIVAAKQEGENQLGSLFWYCIKQQLITREELRKKLMSPM